MNAPVVIERDPQVTDWLEEVARNISDEEHTDLSYRRDRLAPEKLDGFDEDWGFRSDASDYFDANRNHYMEEARQWLAAQVAA